VKKWIVQKMVCLWIKRHLNSHMIFDCMLRYLLPILFIVYFQPVAAQDLSLGLIVHYPFNGNVLDVSPNALHGSLNNAVYTTDQFAVANEALYFNGSTSYVGLPDNPLLKPDFPFTIACMVRYDNPQMVEKTQVFGLDFYQNNYFGSWTNLMTGKVEIAFGGGAGGMGPSNRRTKRGNTTLAANQWYRITYIVRGATDMDIYIDCVNDGGTYSGNGPTQIEYSSVPGSVGRMDGNTGLPAYYFQGALSDFRMWNRALTELEITYMCNECLATVDVEISQPSALQGCAPFVVQFNSTSLGAEGLLWDFGDGNSVIDEVQPSHVFQSPGTYSVVLTGSNQTVCPGLVTTGADTILITVLPQPQVDAGSDIEVCAETAYQLNATGGVSFNWSPPIGLSNPGIGDPLVTVSQNSSYTVTATDENGCTATDQISIYVFEVNADADEFEVCFGQGVTLSADDGISWVWSPAMGLDSPLNQNPVASLHVGEHVLMVTANNGFCDAVDQVTITVYPLPIADAGPDQSGCLNVPIQLNASGGISYLWAPSIGISSNNVSNPVANLEVGTTTFNVTVTDSNGCLSTDEVDVSVLPIPALSISPGMTICRGDSVSLHIEGAVQYSWSPVDWLNDATTNDPVAYPDSIITYSVIGIGQNGCQSSDSVTIDVYRVSAYPSSSSLCLGDSTSLTASDGDTWAWSPTMGLSDSNAQVTVFTPIDIGTYNYSVSAMENGCNDTSTISVTVYALPTAEVCADQHECFGIGVQLSASGGVDYVWSPDSALSSPFVQDPIAFAQIGTTTFVVTVTDSNGCIAELETDVTVTPLPNVLTGPDSTICEGSTIQLYSQGAIDYIWSPFNGLDDPNSGQPTAQPNISTTYFVRGTDANGCTGIDSILISVFSVFASSDTVICSGQTAQLSVNQGSEFEWTPQIGLNSPHNQNPIASPSETTTYFVSSESQYGCIATDSVTIIVLSAPEANFYLTTQLTCTGLLVQATDNSTGAFFNTWFFGTDTVLGTSPPIMAYEGTDSVNISLVITDQENLCSDTMTMTLNVHSLTSESLLSMLGNVVSPNGDNINDCFPPEMSDALIDCYHLLIFDRWGLNVFDSKESESTCWSGSDSLGSSLEDGTYYYVIEILNQTSSGWVFLKSN
jgi:gliding motility-associated-like protein